MMRNTETRPKAPGKAHREGLTVLQLAAMFPTEKASETV